MKNTVLVTGGTGYLGAWVVKGLLEKGYPVRMTVRNKKAEDKYTYLADISNKEAGTLEVYEADLLNPGSYDKAVNGCDTVIHMASPFITKIANPEENLIKPAVKGTENVLNAVNKSGTVKKVIYTSSVVAIYGNAIDMQNQGISAFTEEHWNTTSSASYLPYHYSKVEAEKLAWDMAGKQSAWELVVLNPGFVMGPPLAPGSRSESITLMTDFLTGVYKTGSAVLYYPFVDVRDVADAHIFCLENKAEGRHILSERVTDLLTLTNIIRDHYGDKFKLPKSSVPAWLLKLMVKKTGVSRKEIRNNLNVPFSMDNTKSIKKLGIKYIPLEKTMKDMVDQMISLDMV
jgi:nucleoside-diphosphate-sugar epimerase